jgi:hypothetical protein
MHSTKNHLKKKSIQIILVLGLSLIQAVVTRADTLPRVFYLAQGEENILIRGDSTSDRLGTTIVARGDLNGDGYMDLIVSAPRTQGPAGVGVGITCVFFGTLTFPDTIDLSISIADVTIYGMTSNEWSGSSLACGDLNMDGFDDLAIGAPYSGTSPYVHAGRTYIIFGQGIFPATIDLSVDSADVIIAGGGTDFCLGTAVAIGEINGDGFDDLVVSANNATLPWATYGGEVYVFWGSTSWNPRINLGQDHANLTIQANQAQDHLGTALAVNDINGDSFDDILVGAPNATPLGRMNAGIAYVFNGWATFPDTIRLNQTNADITIYGSSAGNKLGASVAFGDFDFNGFEDLVLGAPYTTTGSGVAAGEVDVILGSEHMSPVYDFGASPPDVKIKGASSNDYAGSAVAVGDVNGDGYYDVIVGAPGADVESETEAGITYVIYGGAFMFPTIFNLATGEHNVIIYGERENDNSGSALATGDINGDGYSDIVIGAYGVDTPGGNNAGAAYVIFGDGDSTVFASQRYTPGGNLPNLRFRPQNAWVDYYNGGGGIISVAKIPSRPLYTSPWVSQVWWELSSNKLDATIIQVTFRYTNEQIAGLNESILTLWWRPFTNTSFIPIPGASTTPATNRITAPVNVLGQFAISDMLHPLGVSLENQEVSFPQNYRLYSPYPNPFNSSVSLHYDLPFDSHVKILIYNILGQKVTSLVDQNQTPGQYQISWDATRNSSGIYFVAMETNNYHAVEKLLLLR